MFGSSIHPHERPSERCRDPQRPLLSVPEGVSGGDARCGDYGARNREVATRTDAQRRSDVQGFRPRRDACRQSCCLFSRRRRAQPVRRLHREDEATHDFPPDQIPAVRVMRLFSAESGRNPLPVASQGRAATRGPDRTRAWCQRRPTGDGVPLDDRLGLLLSAATWPDAVTSSRGNAR